MHGSKSRRPHASTRVFNQKWKESWAVRFAERRKEGSVKGMMELERNEAMFDSRHSDGHRAGSR